MYNAASPSSAWHIFSIYSLFVFEKYIDDDDFPSHPRWKMSGHTYILQDSGEHSIISNVICTAQHFSQELKLDFNVIVHLAEHKVVPIWHQMAGRGSAYHHFTDGYCEGGASGRRHARCNNGAVGRLRRRCSIVVHEAGDSPAF